jgi:hypothetical protein
MRFSDSSIFSYLRAFSRLSLVISLSKFSFSLCNISSSVSSSFTLSLTPSFWSKIVFYAFYRSLSLTASSLKTFFSSSLRIYHSSFIFTSSFLQFRVGYFALYFALFFKSLMKMKKADAFFMGGGGPIPLNSSPPCLHTACELWCRDLVTSHRESGSHLRISD